MFGKWLAAALVCRRFGHVNWGHVCKRCGYVSLPSKATR